jgi:predicted O-methyltransferase YrrM
MTNAELLDDVERLAGQMRAKTMRGAAEFILNHEPGTLVETGCYRGYSTDGESTMIFGMLAKHLGARLISCDIDPDHIAKAIDHTSELADWIEFHQGDSVSILSRTQAEPVFVYLDSLDHDEANPGPCQRHQLAELAAIYGKLKNPCAILMDDNVAPTGGKPALAKLFLEEHGWKKLMEDYQLLYANAP